MSDPQQVATVEAFIQAWARGDVEALMGLMSAECEFHASVGPEPGSRYTGREEVRQAYESFLEPVLGAGTSETELMPPLFGRDFAVVRWIDRAAGGAVKTHGCDVFELEGDRIRRKDTYRKVAP